MKLITYHKISKFTMIKRRTLSQIIFGSGEVYSVSQNKFVDLYDQNRGRIWLTYDELINHENTRIYNDI
jgi:hypothetical protein